MIDTTIAALARLACGPAAVWHCDPDAASQRIYFANHASHLDFVVLWATLPRAARRSVRPVAGRDYWERTRMRRYLAREVFRALLVQRTPAATADRESAAREAIETMAREMGKGISLIVFPEGTRSADGDVGPFKSGLYHLARAVPSAELVPVHLHNLNRILPRGETLPVPMLSRVTFGQPIRVAPGESKTAFLDRARTAVVSLRGSS
jgi:1-acyl-sn-glycerol-3-phosphate acyltransferase